MIYYQKQSQKINDKLGDGDEHPDYFLSSYISHKSRREKKKEKNGPQMRRKKGVHRKGNKSLLKEEMQFKTKLRYHFFPI